MKKQQLVSLLILCGTTLFILALWLSGLTGSIEKKFYDLKFMVRGMQEPSKDVVIVGIDEESLAKFGQWPWPRRILARGIRNLKDAGVNTIAVDIIFPEPSRDPVDDMELASACRYAKCVIGASYYETVLGKVAEMVDGNLEIREELKTQLVLPADTLIKSFKSLGFTNASPDNDGVLRSVILNKEIDGEVYYPLNIFACANYLKKNPGDIKFPANKKILANFRTGNNGYTRYSFKLIYNGGFPKEWIKDKIVFIGSLATGAFDHYPTPYEKSFPGVEFHTTTVDNIINKDYIRTVSPVMIFILIVLFSFGIGYLFINLKPLSGTLVFFGTIIGYFIIVQLLFLKGHVHIDFLKPIMGLVFSFLGIMAYKYSAERKEKVWIKKTFSQYMSPDVIKELTENPDKLKLGGERKNLTVLFSDIRGFTSISEKMEPEEISSLLNEYLSAMVDIVFEYKGTVDKFIGDAVMAFWGAPVPQEDHAKKAVACALAMIRKLTEMQEMWKQQGKHIIDIGVGINTGPMVVGNMGAVQRMDYSIIGDNVNLGSRLEGLTRQYNVKIIISEFTYEIVKDSFECNSLGEVKVKGKQKPVKIYEVVKEK